jgi:hypothetical protein
LGETLGGWTPRTETDKTNKYPASSTSFPASFSKGETVQLQPCQPGSREQRIMISVEDGLGGHAKDAQHSQKQDPTNPNKKQE